MASPKVFVLGIDGGAWPLLDRFTASGGMPTFAALRAASVHAPLHCTQPAHTAPGWASMVSGRYPGNHGVFQFFKTQQADYGACVTTSGEVTSDLFDWLAGAGLSSGNINVPMSHPPRPRSGYSISWPLENTLRFCEPRGLLGEMARSSAHFNSDLACMYDGSIDYIDAALENIRARARSLKYLLSSHPTDLVMLVLTETDRVCHHYWHLMDEGHPAHDPELAVRYGSAIERVYNEVDAALAAVLSELDDDCVVIVVSDHGFGIGLDDLSVNRLLQEMGLQATVRDAAPGGQASWFREEAESIDFTRTRAYSPVPGSFGINLNLRGRQKLGTVSAFEAEGVVRDIEARCKELRSPRTGEPVFDRVLRAEEAYPGPFMRDAPDLLLIPADERTNLGCQVTGPLFRPSYQTGLHRFEGMWMMRSPRVATGALAEPMRIVDVAPTLMADLGLAVPAGLDGRARDDVFGRSGASAGHDHAEKQNDGASAEDAFVSERLRAMGYL